MKSKIYGKPKPCRKCTVVFTATSPRQFYCMNCGSNYFKDWYRKKVGEGKRHKLCKCGKTIWAGSKLCKSCSAVVINKKRAMSGKPYVSKRGAEHGNYDLFTENKQTGRSRALKIYGTSPCQFCGFEKSHIHHIDFDTFNNNPSNIMRLCNNCHQAEHSRLRKLGITYKSTIKK
jgi:hypothetical protein